MNPVDVDKLLEAQKRTNELLEDIADGMDFGLNAFASLQLCRGDSLERIADVLSAYTWTRPSRRKGPSDA